jgi:DNA-binding transcriptional MerR regulator
MSTQLNEVRSYSIKEASRLTGLPSSTLRYYETIGIVKPVQRGETSNHRVYNQRDIDILDTVACLNATGMKLDDMKSYIANLSDDVLHTDDQVTLLAAQLKRLADEERQITLRRQYVNLKIDYWNAVKSRDEPRVHAIAAQARELSQVLKKV